MSKYFRTGLFALVITLSTLAFSGAAQAWWCSSCNRTGVVFNSNDGQFYPVPASQRGVVYRVADGNYIPVGHYGYCCHRVHHHHRIACYDRTPRIACTVRPAHWEGFMEWKSASNYCFYYVRPSKM